MSETVQYIGRRSAVIGLASGALFGAGTYALLESTSHSEEERVAILSSCAQGITSLAGADNLGVDSEALPEACEDSLVVNDFGYTVISTYKPVNLGEPVFDKKVKVYNLPSAQAFFDQKSTETPFIWNTQMSIGTASLFGILLGTGAGIISNKVITTNEQLRQRRLNDPINYPPKKR